MNYFSKGKGVNRVNATVNQVHGPGSHGPPASLNRGCWLLDGRLGIKAKGYAASNLGPWSPSVRLLVLRPTTDGAQAWRGGAIGEAYRSYANRQLRSLVSYGVSLYGIGETKRTRCTYLGEAASGRGGRRRQDGLGQAWWHRGRPPVFLQWQEWNEWTTHVPLLLLDRSNCFKRWRKIKFESDLGFGVFFDLRLKIWAQSADIYRGFVTES
jgi:hypothetical protein